MRLSFRSLILSSAFLFVPSSAVVQAEENADAEAIRQTAKTYLEALRRGDASAVEKFWVKDGVLTDATGRSQPAHELIQTEFGVAAAAVRPEITIDSSDIRFITPDVAIEVGTSTHKVSDASHPVKGRFTAIWVRKQDKWLLSDLRESPLDLAPQAGPLEPLNWLIGEWVSRRSDPQVRILCTWSDNKKYILQRISIREKGQDLLDAVQRIAWDASAGRIRSWVFDSEGAFVESLWNQEGDAWIVSASGVRADGTKAKTIDFWVPEGKDRFAFKATNPLLAKNPAEPRIVEFLRVRD